MQITVVQAGGGACGEIDRERGAIVRRCVFVSDMTTG